MGANVNMWLVFMLWESVQRWGDQDIWGFAVVAIQQTAYHIVDKLKCKGVVLLPWSVAPVGI